MKEPPRHTHTYFAHSRARAAWKIGQSKHPLNRLVAIKSTHRVGDVELIAVFDYNIFPEQHLHQRFSHLAIGNEWFSDSPEINAFLQEHEPMTVSIESIRATHPILSFRQLPPTNFKKAIEGFSAAQIAETLGCPISTAYAWKEGVRSPPDWQKRWFLLAFKDAAPAPEASPEASP